MEIKQLTTRCAALWREVAGMCAQIQAAVLVSEALCREVTERRHQSPYQAIEEERTV
jgi:hypothetical protein